MEKKFLPRVWLPQSAIDAFSKRMSMLDQKHFISAEEHDAIVKGYEEKFDRLKKEIVRLQAQVIGTDKA